MRDVLFTVFGLPIHAYGTMLSLAFLVAIVLAARDAKKQGIPSETIVDLALCLCLGGLAGGRLLYVLLDYQYYLKYPLDILNLPAGGLSYFGGAIAAFAAGWVFVRRKHYDPWRIADLAAPYVALGYAITRVGCLLHGCCYGVPSNVPWAMACKAGDATLRHPTQIYASLGSLLLFFLLYRLRGHKRFPGFLFLLYMGLYGIMRGIIECFRESAILFGPIRTTQAACLAATVAAGLLIWQRERRRIKMRMESRDGAEMGG